MHIICPMRRNKACICLMSASNHVTFITKCPHSTTVPVSQPVSQLAIAPSLSFFQPIFHSPPSPSVSHLSHPPLSLSDYFSRSTHLSLCFSSPSDYFSRSTSLSLLFLSLSFPLSLSSSISHLSSFLSGILNRISRTCHTTVFPPWEFYLQIDNYD